MAFETSSHFHHRTAVRRGSSGAGVVHACYAGDLDTRHRPGRPAPDRRARAPRGVAPADQTLEAMGSVSERARLGQRARGLQPGRHGLGLLPPRPRPVARVPVERGRHRRDLGPASAHLLRAGAVERPRPDPEGTAVRADGQRGEPRRGREGVLLLPGQHPHPLLHAVPLQVPAGRVSLRPAGRGKPSPRARGTRVRADGHGRLRGPPVLRRRGRVREERPRGHPHRHSREQPRARGGAAGAAADHLVPEHLVMAAGCCPPAAEGGAGAPRDGRAVRAHVRHPVAPLRGRTAAPRHRERDQHGAALRRSERPAVLEGRVPPVPDRRRGRCGHSRPRRDEGGGPLPAARAGRRHGDGSPPAERPGARQRPADRGRLRPDHGRPPPRGRRVLRHDRARHAFRGCGERLAPGAGSRWSIPSSPRTSSC
jgi:hypothetical protein